MKKWQLYGRRTIQLLFVVLTAFLALSHQKYGIEKVASIDAYCPFGGVESLFTLIFQGKFLQRIYWSSVILLGVYLIGTLIIGRVFCSYVCPFGAIQEWIRAVASKYFKIRARELPEKVDRWLRWVKYGVLLVVVYFSFYLGDLVFRNYDPYNAWMHFGEEWVDKPVGYGLLIMFLVAAVFFKNWWCRYFCPLGAFWAIVKRFGLLKLRRDNKTCIQCGSCDEVCPAGLKIKSIDEVRSVDCISCGQCISQCPRASLSYSILGKKISLGQHGLLVIALVILPIALISNTRWWQTKPATNLITVEGKIDVNNIRGSNTLNNIIETTKIPFEEFATKFGLPNNVDRTMKLKDIGVKYGLKNEAGEVLETEDWREYIRTKLN